MLSGTAEMDWIQGLELLSLDFVRPVYDQLGVGIEHEETLRGLARDTLMGRLSGQSLMFELESWSDPAEAYSVWIAPLQNIIASSLGPDAIRNLTHWIRYVACTDELRNPWLLYYEVLTSWGSGVRRTGLDRMNLSIDTAAVAAEMKVVLDTDAPEALLAARASRPITDWDLLLFRRLGWDQVPEGSDFCPFKDAAVLAMTMSRFQHFWRRTLPRLSPEDIAAIGRDARALSQKSGMCYVAPGDLNLPGQVVDC